MSQTISILGCGWMGLPLGHYLKTKGYQVKGSVRNSDHFPQLEEAGIQPFQLTVEAERLLLNDPDFFNCDILFISIPPGRREGNVEDYANKLRVIRSAIDTNNISKVIFISSTSVYPELKRFVTEDDAKDPDKLSGKVLLEAENALLLDKEYDLIILRMAGLIGLNRNPLNFLKKGNTEKSTNIPMNLIHIDDVIGTIDAVIEKGAWNKTFNACSTFHPTRHEFYALAAKLNGMEQPQFKNDSSATYKLVGNNKLLTLTGYRFKYENPLDYVREIYHNESPH